MALFFAGRVQTLVSKFNQIKLIASRLFVLKDRCPMTKTERYLKKAAELFAGDPKTPITQRLEFMLSREDLGELLEVLLWSQSRETLPLAFNANSLLLALTLGYFHGLEKQKELN